MPSVPFSGKPRGSLTRSRVFAPFSPAAGPINAIKQKTLSGSQGMINNLLEADVFETQATAANGRLRNSNHEVISYLGLAILRQINRFSTPSPLTTMAPDPQCAALNAAKTKKGWSYAQIADKIGQSEQHVVDVCTGKSKPTQAEFNALAQALGITDQPPHDSSHATV